MLECEIKAADGTQAYQALKEYENLIFSKEWHHTEAPERIKRIAQTFQMTKIELQDLDTDSDANKAHLKLG
jgi:hypothetical protein